MNIHTFTQKLTKEIKSITIELNLMQNVFENQIQVSNYCITRS